MPGAPGSVVKASSGAQQYNIGQLEQLWITAAQDLGDSNAVQWAPTAAAIAYAESRGDPLAKNPSGATGLWQILGNPSGFNGNLDTPSDNATAAVLKWEQAGNSFTPWTTFTSGAYKSYLSEAQQVQQQQVAQNNPLTGVPGASTVEGAVNAVGDTAGAIKDVGQGIVDFVQAITNLENWLRLGEVLVGIWLIFIGIKALTGGQIDPAGTIGRAAKSGVGAAAAL